jgi:hypothetical protein
MFNKLGKTQGASLDTKCKHATYMYDVGKREQSSSPGCGMWEEGRWREGEERERDSQKKNNKKEQISKKKEHGIEHPFLSGGSERPFFSKLEDTDQRTSLPPSLCVCCGFSPHISLHLIYLSLLY